MKGGTVQISWHGLQPILSVDFHLPTGLLATAGADHDIKLWSLHRAEKSKALPSATFKANLSYHGAAVNVLRFSPSGELLASGGDNGELLIWKIAQGDEEIPSWKVWKTLRFHVKDVLDLGWSPDGTFLVSGSVDNTTIIWNVLKGTVEQVLSDHQHYVQGVTWDPLGHYVASLSGDRTCRIYSLRPPTKKSKGKEKNAKRMYTCQHVLCKTETSPAAASAVAAVATVDVDDAPQKQVSSSKQYLFFDESMPSFFRRLSWSPDGSFLLLPSGVEKQSPEAASCSVSYIVSRNDLSRPVLQLPAGSKAVVAARFCPVIYSLCPEKSRKHDTNVPGTGAFKLPYRVLFAVATLNSVFIYDTEQSCPIAIFGGLHYAAITDLAWSFDAKFLAVSSQDGYCTLVGFDEGDLGSPVPLADLLPKTGSQLLESQLAGKHGNLSVPSPSKDISEKGGDSPLSEPAELLQKMVLPEKDAAPGSDHSPILSSGKTLKTQYIGNVRPHKIHKLNPKPIFEYLQKSTVSKSEAIVTTHKSAGLNPRECTSQGARCGQNAAEVPLKASQIPVGQIDLIRPRIDVDKRLEVEQLSVVSNSGSEQGGTPPYQAVNMETSALLQSCSMNKQANPDDTSIVSESHKRELSRKDQQGVGESAQGPTTPVCQEHAIGLGVNPANSQKPRDQYTDLYVRPLKFRRISPNLIPADLDKPDTLKPLPSQTSISLSNGCKGLQPI